MAIPCLGQMHEAFLCLSVESMVHDNQQVYYNAINESTKTADCGVFINFMLTEIYEVLKVYQREKAPSGALNQIFAYIKSHPGSRSNFIADELNIPRRSVQAILNG